MNIDLTLLSNDVADSLFIEDLCANISDLVSQYNNTLIYVLDKKVKVEFHSLVSMLQQFHTSSHLLHPGH